MPKPPPPDTHLAHAEQVYADFQRNMLTDLCLLLSLIGGAWFAVSLAFPDFWRVLTQSRQGILGSWVFFLGLTSSIFLLLKLSKRPTTMRVAAAIFVIGSFGIAVVGPVLSGFGVRALAFYLLPITLTFVTFHYGIKVALRLTILSIALIVSAAALEWSGLVRGASVNNQPYAVVGFTLTALAFLTLNALYLRFDQRFNRLIHRYEEQWVQLQDSLNLMRMSLSRKRSFSKLLSHSTRTPLAGVQFVLELLGRTNLSAPVFQRTLAALDRHAFRLRMMGVHLELARKARDPDPLPVLHVFSPHILWSSCLQQLSAEASYRNISLEFIVQGGAANAAPAPASLTALPEVISDDPDSASLGQQMSVLADPGILGGIVQVLLDNAIKAQSGGTISTHLSINPQGFLMLQVHDEGSGMSEQRAAELMRPLGLMSDDHSHDTGEGLGLGLPVLSTLCEQLGGRFAFSPNPHGGSIFTVCLPTRADMLPSSSMQASNNVSGKTDAEAELSALRARNQAGNSSGRAQAIDQPLIRKQLLMRSKRVVTFYMGLIVALIAVMIANQAIQALAGSELARQAFINASGAGLFSICAMVMSRKGYHRLAAGVLIVAFLLFTFNAMVIIGMGPRSPIAILPAAAIALAHFQFGARVGSITCAAALLSLGFSYALEFNGVIPGTHGELFPPSINVVMAFVPVYVLGFVCAYEMQGRSEITLQAMREQNQALVSAIHQAMLADFSQNRFLQAVSPRLIAQCHELADVCAELSRQSHSCMRETGLFHCDATTRLRVRAAELNRQVTADFDEAVGAVQTESPGDAASPNSNFDNRGGSDSMGEADVGLSGNIRRFA